ncbi:MAG TPA: phosphoribosylglycinamide formyltransferase [Thermomicrobiaceae bacterium]|nr:phosphoribosylglycinamide formyltransferase [Thermomicrobiaceae bacterium]
MEQADTAKAGGLRIAVLLSGTGRTLENLIAVIGRGELRASVVAVVSSRASVRGNDVARAANLPLFVVPRRRFASVESFSQAVYASLDPFAVDLIVLAGFLSQLTIPPAYRSRVMNVHPSLLPLFGGLGFWGERVHRAVLDAGMKVSGCTVHFVDEHYDAGPIILQRCVPVLEDDTTETLAARVFVEEQRLYPEAIRLFGQDRLRVDGQRVRILPA